MDRVIEGAIPRNYANNGLDAESVKPLAAQQSLHLSQNLRTGPFAGAFYDEGRLIQDKAAQPFGAQGGAE